MSARARAVTPEANTVSKLVAFSARLPEDLLQRLSELGADTKTDAVRLVLERYFALHDQSRRAAGAVLRAHPDLAKVGRWIKPEEVKTIVYTMPAIAREYAGQGAAAAVEQLDGLQRLALYDLARSK